jgi:taurine dioxygenase
MAYETIEVTKLTPNIGAEIGGVDLSRPLGNRQFQEIHDALLDNLVIFFRDQHLTHDQHKDFARRFGRLMVHPVKPRTVIDPEITPIHPDENSTNVAGEDWHTDLSFSAVPPMGSILYIQELPPVGGDTLFASMYAAYDALSPKMQVFLSGLTAIHDGEARFRPIGLVPREGDRFAQTAHPIVRTHAGTGRKLLFVNQEFTTRIEGLTRGESDALLRMLFRHIETPELQCRFRWQRNSVAFWDNRCAQHQAVWDYFPQRRHGYRVTIEDDPALYRT